MKHITKPTDGPWYVSPINRDGSVSVEPEGFDSLDNDGSRIATFHGPDALSNAIFVASVRNAIAEGQSLELKLPYVHQPIQGSVLAAGREALDLYVHLRVLNGGVDAGSRS